MVVIYHGVPEKNEVYAWKIRFIRFLRQAQGAKSLFPAQNYYFFLICANISPFSSLYFSCGFPREIIRHLFCFCQWSDKSPLPLHLTLYTKKNRTKIRHFLAYITQKHYFCIKIYSSNYGTQILSSLWCCIYLSARESR